MINYDLGKISTLIYDVDGVLSRSTISMTADGIPQRTINIKDGYAIQHAAKMGLGQAIITGGVDEAIRLRYTRLGLTDIFMGAGVKIQVYEDYIKRHGIDPSEVIYIGDDIPDYEVMLRVGCPCCPKDAAADIRHIARYVSPFAGGEGCVRDVLEQVLRARGQWLSSAAAFGW